MLVHSGFVLSWKLHLVDCSEVVSQVVPGLLESDCVLQGAVDMGPLHSTCADLTIMFMARAKSATEIVQLVIMPFSSRGQADVTVPDETLNLKLL